MIWWNQGGLNSRPPACKAGALPTELRPRISDFVRYFEELNLSITLITGSSPYLHYLLCCSATRETSLSFGERPLTSCPSPNGPILMRDCLLANFTSRSEFENIHFSTIVSNKDKSICPMATLTSDFRYIWISPVSRQKRIIGFTSVILATTPIPHRLILSPRASIAAPESSVHYKAITLGDTCFRWRFPPPYQVSLPGNSPT